jgi:hypothetical protein
MNPVFRFFVGIDWAREEHTVCVVNTEGQVVDRRTIAQSGAAIVELGVFLATLGQPDSVAVAIEAPRGAVVEHLMERRFTVFSINPKQLDRFRDRHTMAGAKDDRLDAFVLGDALRTDLALFHKVRLDYSSVLRLRELSRAEEEIHGNLAREENRLGDLLNRYFPQLLGLCPAANEPWLWDLLKKTPLPESAARLSQSKLATLLRSHRIRRFNAEDLQKVLRETPLPLAPGAATAISERAVMLLPALRLWHRQGQDIAKRIKKLLEEMSQDENWKEHRDVQILLSLPGVGRIISATMLAEAGQALAERDYHALRSYGGCAPVTRQSGKRKIVLMRYGCNRRVRQVLYHWARVSSQHDPHSQNHYAALRAKGHSHGRALRGVVDRLLAMLMAMLRSGTAYDPDRRSATQPTTVSSAAA